ncbi:hypothetical protein AMS68_003140 [Peltaster fructicola]|uniref:NAD(P)-binding protein n=1 Tax=Peltaster fructicola TaxID=286661 RepID=A0A6H0XSD2_9PEZI|nr:hypothetical protein AMS68_003140 [Peltaster fructicola]
MAPTVLITGTSSGIGHSLAREFKSRGYTVFATARKTSSIDDLSKLGIETLALEVTSKESIDALKEEIISRTGGKLDILVNNAGRNYTVPALDVDYDEIELTFRTNVYAVMQMCQAFAPLLMASKGTIVQIGSVAAIQPYVFGSTYNASKAALHSYSDTLRVELSPFDVKVVVVITGGVKSEIARTKRVLPPDSIYVPVEKEYQERLVHSQTNGMETDLYARTVVSKLLASPGRYDIWAGGKSTLIWFVSTFLPKSTWIIVFTRMFSLFKLRQHNKTV